MKTLALRACPVPVVASVQGLCLAGGVGLVLGCDHPQRIRITPDGRAQLCFVLPRPEVAPADVAGPVLPSPRTTASLLRRGGVSANATAAKTTSCGVEPSAGSKASKPQRSMNGAWSCSTLPVARSSPR